MELMTMAASFILVGQTFSLAPFDTILQPLINETLTEHGKDRYRKGTRLIPKVLIWLVLVLTLRRDLNYDKALNWMVSGFRWLTDLLPADVKIVGDGAISHARVQLGVGVFRTLFAKLVATFHPLPADFHGRISVIFDGLHSSARQTRFFPARLASYRARSAALTSPSTVSASVG